MISKIEAFTIEVVIDRKRFRMHVQQVYVTAQIEQFKVTGGKRSILFQTDRPLWRNKGINKRKYSCAMVEGKTHNIYAVEKISKAIQYHINSLEHPPFDNREHPKNSGLKR